MVKGISRQVIVVQSPDPRLFEQAIFILKDDALRHGGVSEEELLREAKAVLRSGSARKTKLSHYGPVWACGGALLTGTLWFLSVIL